MLIDITRPFNAESVVWPGDVKLEITDVSSIARGDHSNVSRLQMTNHMGTHMDAPLHFIEGGQPLDMFSIERFRMPALVIQVDESKPMVDAESLAGQEIKAGDGILFKTGNAKIERDRFRTEFVAIAPDAARILAEKRVGLVGIDYLSVDPYETKNHPAHHALLGAGILILEEADLRQVEPGRYTLWCFPLKLARGNGAPCRAVLERK